MPWCTGSAAGAYGGGRPLPRPLLRPSPSANLAGKGKGDPLRREVRVVMVVQQRRAAGVRRIKTTDMSDLSLIRMMKNFFIGRERDLTDHHLFHKLSLVAILAWVGLGADGLSSSCYGPEEAYKVLLAHPPLAVFCRVDDCRHSDDHLRQLLADHRIVSGRRRGLSRGQPAALANGRCGFGLGPAH